MARSLAKRPMDIGKKWARQEGKGIHPSNTQSKEEMEGRKHEPKGPYVFHTARVKHLPERTVESDKHEGNNNDMKAKKVMDSNESRVYTQGPDTTYLYTANTWEVSHESKV